ncbi:MULTISPECIES: dihydrofolate reductase family protein [unclassified Rathayibacter]|uniref:dihydrofolate reductase family protein n=1 Tax=unclassified Rathayibacter TaxID=2609250 RepID=UPI00188BC881|nr:MULTISPECIES: dihydrofolate reductase family protein [unclassified Rathayibacter]MBF4462109.1 dihydrofolate reductase family protein [Rathayibacter sp. VKM Ac-2879]MBF4503848.1 dihydrofolate reductase family protein [Rathayibacter sp. VKM Ac-2878]
MGALIYSGIVSLDGYTADETGGFGWAEPRPEVHSFINERTMPVRTFYFGRRMYETMRAWETPFALAEEYTFIRDFQQIWHAADKIVHSTTLTGVTTRRTTLERAFDPVAVASAVRASEHDSVIAGPGLASHALLAGVVDEIQLYTVPVTVGGGTPFFPRGMKARLELREERRFRDGTVFLRYSVRH